MEFENHNQVHVDKELIARLRRTWPKRATVRGDYFNNGICQDNYQPEKLDYPTKLLPFWHHPDFARIDDEIKYKVLTWGWLEYNKRTIHAEEKVANPAFELLMASRYPGVNDSDIKAVVQQSLIDEHFHSLMHYTVIEQTRNLRGIDYNIDLPDSITYRLLQKAMSEVSSNWERDTLILIWAIVSEISINALLDLLAKDKTIQPNHQMITYYHNRDEFAHASILIEIAKTIYHNLNKQQRSFFIRYLPKAMSAFAAQDYTAWEGILNFFKVKNTAGILADTQKLAGNNTLIRNFSGLKKVATLLEITDELEFDFNAYN